ncbi:hypothetical protein A3K87_18935 [Variovorax paradoxus]|uniref:Uncharacterized protein n=1 Tax=Variovorax paradoxus TaxID=34073 RepID=A0AA91DNX3_VARPD|nr:hypothetical protein A3K87_18935 [Variovorax paradoxus]
MWLITDEVEGDARSDQDFLPVIEKSREPGHHLARTLLHAQVPTKRLCLLEFPQYNRQDEQHNFITHGGPVHLVWLLEVQ